MTRQQVDLILIEQNAIAYRFNYCYELYGGSRSQKNFFAHFAKIYAYVFRVRKANHELYVDGRIRKEY